MKKTKTLVGLLVAAVVVAALSCSGWMPAELKLQMADLRHQLTGAGGFSGLLAHLLTAALCAAAIVGVYLLLKLLLGLTAKKSNRAATVSNLVIAVVKYAAIVVGIVLVLRVLGVDLTVALAGVGLLGLILGFGAQSLIEDVITGVFVILEGQYNIGDIIILDEFRGTVREIGVRTTVIEDAGGNLKVVNNSDIRNFQNRSKKESVAICEISVAYATNLDRLSEVFAAGLPEIYGRHGDLFLAEPVYLGVNAFLDSGIALKIVAKCEEANVFTAQRMLNYEIKTLFDRKGIEIPFPQVVVHQA